MKFTKETRRPSTTEARRGNVLPGHDLKVTVEYLWKIKYFLERMGGRR